MVREHDEHLLPHDPTLGTEREDKVTHSSEVAAPLPLGKWHMGPLGGKEGSKVYRVCRRGELLN